MTFRYEDIEITSGARNQGGQQVGVTSGVTVTHLPSGISVTMPLGRSQLRNKIIALNLIAHALESEKELNTPIYYERESLESTAPDSSNSRNR